MVPLRARATRARGVPQPFCGIQMWCASKEQEEVTTKLRRAQAYSVVERAAECGAKSRDVRCHSQTAESTGGTAAAYKLRQALPWPLPALPVLFCP